MTLIQSVEPPDPFKCSQDGCPDRATTIVYWPGKTPPPRYCDEHATSARNILAHMGCPVHTAMIGDDGGVFKPSLADA